MEINEILARRTDLSTFLVHFSRDYNDSLASENLEQILQTWAIDARNPMGHACRNRAVESLSDDERQRYLDTQRCVCFTETPLHYASLLLEQVTDLDRSVEFQPHGIAITKKQGRLSGVNPVWYVDITRRPDRATWLSVHINELIRTAVRAEQADAPIWNLTPFIEPMGTGRATATGRTYRKEFWWEREWRHVGSYTLPERILVLCPEHDHERLGQLVLDSQNQPEEEEEDPPMNQAHFVDPSWSLEQIIARLAGFSSDDIGPL